MGTNFFLAILVGWKPPFPKKGVRGRAPFAGGPRNVGQHREPALLRESLRFLCAQASGMDRFRALLRCLEKHVFPRPKALSHGTDEKKHFFP